MSIAGLTGRTRTAQVIIDFRLAAVGGTSRFECDNGPFASVIVSAAGPPIVLSAGASASNVFTGVLDQVTIDIYVGMPPGTATGHYRATMPIGSYVAIGTLTVSGTAQQFFSAGTDGVTFRTFFEAGEYTQQGITVTVDWNGIHTFVMPPWPGTRAEEWAYKPGGKLSLQTYGSATFGGGSDFPGSPNQDGLPIPVPQTAHSYFHPNTPYVIGVPITRTGDFKASGADGLFYKVGSYTEDFTAGCDLTISSLATYYPYTTFFHSGVTGYVYKWTGPLSLTESFSQEIKHIDLKGEFRSFEQPTGLNPRSKIFGAVANPNDNPPTVGLDGDVQSLTIVQKFTNSTATFDPALNTIYDNPVVQADGLVISMRSLDFYNSADSGFSGPPYPCRLFNWPVWTITHAATFNLPSGTWSATGAYAVAAGVITPSLSAGTAVFTIPRFIMEGYRYLKIPVTCTDAGGQDLTITINGKSWAKHVTTSTVFIEVDLCAPDGGLTTLLGQDSRWPLVFDTGHWRPRDEGVHWGINQTTAIAFSLISTVTPITIGAMSMFRKNDPLFEGITEYVAKHTLSVDLAGHPLDSASRMMLALVDGRLSLEWPAHYDLPSGATSNFVGYVNTIPGWTATLEPNGPFYVSSGGDPLWSAFAQQEAAFAGGYFDHTSGFFVDSSKVTMTGGTYTGIAQLSFNELRAHPGCGDPMTGAGYGWMSGSTPLPFFMQIRGKVWGLAFSSGVPVSGFTVTVTQTDTGAGAGSGVTDAGGYWESGLPFCRHAKNVTVGTDVVKAIGDRRTRAIPTVSGGPGHLTRSDHDGLLYAVYVGTSDLQVNRFDLSGFHDETLPVGVGVVTSAQIAAGPQGHLLIAYEHSSSTLVTRSTNAAESWDTPVSVAALTDPAVAIDPDTGVEFIAGHDGTNWVLYRSDDTGTYHLIDTIVTLGHDTGRGLEVNKSAGRELVFWVNDAGHIRKFVSTHYGLNWNEV